jgi:GNAT superfamily N-acetyltransferase
MTDWKPLERSKFPKTSNVYADTLTRSLVEPFDYEFDGNEEFYPWRMPELPAQWGIGVIVGASGTGKSTLLNCFGRPQRVSWNNGFSIASHFDSAADASDRLAAAGLMSIPEWCKPYNVLSTGQKFRADLARSIYDNAVLDEFTSVVDRNVAKAASTAMARYVRNNGITNIVVATCHRDVLEFLEPDWIIDTDRGLYAPNQGQFQRPELALTIYPADRRIWDYFAPYHYLSDTHNKSARAYVAVWEGQLVGFNSVISFPSGTVKNAFRGHRLVVHPDFQGFGFGHRISEAVAQHYLDNGKRYFAKTAHPRLGGYRDNSPLWRPTHKNHMRRKDADGHQRWQINRDRWTYSHEYIGEK